MSFPIYSLSDSDPDSADEKDSDEERFLLDTSSPFFKKPKVSQSPIKKSRSPTKPKASRKTDEDKRRIQEEKQRVREEKLKAAEEKRKAKVEKKKESELLKQLKPGECMKFISVFVDSNLLNQQFGSELLSALKKHDIKCTVREQRIPGTISWQRNMEERSMNISNHIVVVWTWKELIKLISCNQLNEAVNELLRLNPEHKLTIVIFGIEDYFKQRKTKENRELRTRVFGEEPNKTRKDDFSPELATDITRDDVEMALATLQLMLNVQYKFFETKEEIGLFVFQFTKAMAELPYKLQKSENRENTEWYAEADSRECVPVDKNGNGLSRLWQQQLCQFPSVGLDFAQAVAAEYPSPTLLMEAYNLCSTEQERELLLQNIQIRRTQGPIQISSRHVGPQFSKKSYNFFYSTDGDVMLS